MLTKMNMSYLPNPASNENEGISQEFGRHLLLSLAARRCLQQHLRLGLLLMDKVNQELLANKYPCYSEIIL